MKIIIKKLFASILFLNCFVIHANPTNDLFEAIKYNDAQTAQNAIDQGADVNAHGITSNIDFAATDWNPLMRSIAQLNSTIIKSQSDINTVAQLSQYLLVGSALVSGLASIYAQSWYPFAITTGIASLPFFF